MATLRQEVWERDKGICQRCSKPCREDDWDMSHRRNKRMWGDSVDNCEVNCRLCHRVIWHQNGGVEKIVPAKETL